jgi:uncharacterized protein (DUF885 family)
MATIRALSDVKRDELRAKAEEIVRVDVYPAWQQATALLGIQLLRATDDAGLWRLKDGAGAYAYFLRRYTTTNMTPDQIYELGLRQVESIEREMDALLHRLGRDDGPINGRIDQLRQDLTYPSPASDESRDQIMRDINDILHDANERAAQLFDKTPTIIVKAEPHAPAFEKTAPPSYREPSRDGSRPGIFQYPRSIEWMTKFRLRTIVYHETVPGHHFDIALAVENKDLPEFRQLGTFGSIDFRVEGWGLYAEHLAAKSGWYGNDLEGLLGELWSELLRARRLVVDTGLHWKRWTKQEAIDHGVEAEEVERYVVDPGQATSYMIGAMKILELRDKANRALGDDKFSLKEFHNMVLDAGAVPLEILERQTDAYIARASGRNRARP